MKRAAALGVVLLALLLCTGCGSNSAATRKTTDTMRISAILPHNDYGYWTMVAGGINEAGGELPVSVKIYLPQLNYNVDQMTDLIRQQTAAQTDALIVQGIEDEGYLDALEDARQQGVQIVFVDTDVPTFGTHLYVGTDNYNAGRKMGHHLVEVTGGSAKVAVLSGAPGYPNLELRLKGLRDAVANTPGIEIMRVEYDEYDALTVMQKYALIRAQSPEIDTLVCIEGTGAQTLGQLAPQSEDFAHILGFDDSDEALAGIKAGLIDGLMIQQTREMGQTCVQELYRYRTKGSYSASCIYTDLRWITAADLDEEGNYDGR